MRARLVRFLRHDDAATAVEYAVLLGLIFMTVFTAVMTFGQTANQSWQNSTNSLSDVNFGS